MTYFEREIRSSTNENALGRHNLSESFKILVRITTNAAVSNAAAMLLLVRHLNL